MDRDIISRLTINNVKSKLLKYEELSFGSEYLSFGSTELTFDEEVLLRLGKSVIDDIKNIKNTFEEAYKVDSNKLAPLTVFFEADFKFTEKYQIIYDEPANFLQTIYDLYASFEKNEKKYKLELSHNFSQIDNEQLENGANLIKNKNSIIVSLLPRTPKTTSSSVSSALSKCTLNLPISS